MRVHSACVAAALGSLFLAGQASAVQIWAYDNLAAGSNNLISFDSATPGSVTVVGSSGMPGMLFGGMDFAANGTLYAYGFNPSTGAASGLCSVNLSTGAATVIGSGGLLQGDNINDMTYNPVTGQMLGVATGNTAGVNNLYSFNLATGAATLVGPITGMTNALNVGLASNSAGVNFVHDIATDQMFSLAGLVATPLGPEGILTNFSQGMTIDWSGSGTWYHAAVINSPTTAVNLYTVSPLGVATLVGSIGPGPLSYECGDIAIRPVPAPGAFALLGLGGLIAGRRRR